MYELLENKIQLLQEVSGASRRPEGWAPPPLRPSCSPLQAFTVPSPLPFPDAWRPCVLGLPTSLETHLSVCFSLQESRLAKNEAARMAALVEAEKECNLELSEKLKGITTGKEDGPGDQVKPDQYAEALAQRDK